jgi:hypothetical protein
MDQESGSIDLEHVDQYCEEERELEGFSGPDEEGMKISSEFFQKIMDVKYKEEKCSINQDFPLKREGR